MPKDLKIRTRAVEGLPATLRYLIEGYERDGIKRGFLKFMVPEAPPTVNHMYQHTRRGTFLTKEVQNFRRHVHFALAASGQKFICTGTMAMIICLETPYWVTKKSTIREMDCDNRIKPVIDAVKLSLQIPDETVWELHVYKMPSKKIQTTVYLFDLGDIVDVYS